jgi:hypothetical protein
VGDECDGNIMYSRMKMVKWDLLKLFQEWGRGDKEWWRGWIQIWHIVRTFVNVTMYPQYNNMTIKNIKNTFKKGCVWLKKKVWGQGATYIGRVSSRGTIFYDWLQILFYRLQEIIKELWIIKKWNNYSAG